MALPTHVTDMNGVRYTLSRPIGEGGQGTVVAVRGSRLAVKLLHERSAAQRERLRGRLALVRRLNLANLCVARPLEMLREPHCGYVMELLTGMQPVQRLLQLPRDTTSSARWYIEGGGLGRRLRLMARAADILNALHGRGLVYGDVSPNNLFVSEDAAASETWFIDADNIRYESSPSCAGTFTPGYGAPELVHGRAGTNSLTDAYAFGVLCFQTLAILYPFAGDAVSNGEPEMEERAMRGELPWVDDPADNSNRASAGIPRDWVLSPRLRDLCYQAFGPGKRDHLARPGVGEWSERLHAAADNIVHCPDCQATFFANAACCPWCDTPRPTVLTISFCVWDPAIKGDDKIVTKPSSDGIRRRLPAAQATSGEGAVLQITRRLGEGCLGPDGEVPLVEVQLLGREVRLRSISDSECWLQDRARPLPQDLSDRWKLLPLSRLADHVLHFGPREQLHRTAMFAVRPGGAR